MPLQDLDDTTPVLIAGPTASGKSALALDIARRSAVPSVIVNADALQVFAGWQILTARPGAPDLAEVPHLLYGHVSFEARYSVGAWLRDVAPIFAGRRRPIIVGGTGLYFQALTGGLSEIPEVPADVRAEGDALRRRDYRIMLGALDDTTRRGLDARNPMRVQRAWEVQRSTGRGMAEWQSAKTAPLLDLEQAACLRLEVLPEHLNQRIAARFDVMVAQGLLDEVARQAPLFRPDLASAKAIGARELISYLAGEMTLSEARNAVIIATRQYAKRQRTWMRSKMASWTPVPLPHGAYDRR
ncbi:MAG: tRNA (adenosine(37)-N6)-dimethylallyltransferase MiaA [Pseudomonadota bacterium]